LFLDVSITAQSIVDAAWARATANRERLRRRLDVQSVREEAGRNAGRGWEQRYTTPTPLQYRPDEPVAYPMRRTTAPPSSTIFVGRVFVSDDGGLLDGNVWSGNGNQRVSAAFSFNGFPLPIGGQRCIFVTQPPPADEDPMCFYVDPTSARQVTTPASLLSGANEAFDLVYRFGLFGTAFQQSGAPANLVYLYTPSIFLAFPSLYPGIHPPTAPDPGVLSVLRSLTGSIAPGLDEIAVTSNVIDNPVINNGAFIDIVDPMAYRWTAADPADDDFTAVPFTDSRWEEVTINRPEPVAIPIIPGLPTSAFSNPSAYYFWDWGLPAYCRAQLLALGFSPADLEP
jgi:hypothetical protein